MEASVRDEMFLALFAHSTAVIPIEVVQVGVFVVGCCADIGRAARIVTPGRALERKSKDDVSPKHHIPILYLLFDSNLSPVGKGLPRGPALLCGVCHPCTC